jgi:hypothetical protein
MFGTPEILSSESTTIMDGVLLLQSTLHVSTWPAIYATAQNRQSQLPVITMHYFKDIIPDVAIRATCVLPTVSAEIPMSMTKRITHGSSGAQIRRSQTPHVGTTAIKSIVSSTRVSLYATSYSYRRYASASISISSGRYVVLQ